MDNGLVNNSEGEMCQNDTFTLDEAADNISRAKKLIVMSVLEIGRNLYIAKSICKHGEWLKFLDDDRVKLSRRTAQRYLQIYKTLEPYLAYTDLLNDLKFSELYNLIMMDKDDMEELIQTSNTVKELQEGIKNSKEKNDIKTHLADEDIDIIIKLSHIDHKYAESGMRQRIYRLGGYTYGLKDFNLGTLNRILYGYNEYFDILADMMEDLTYTANNYRIVQTRPEFMSMNVDLSANLFIALVDLMETNYKVATWIAEYCKTNKELKFGEKLIDSYTLGHVYNEILNSDNMEELLDAQNYRIRNQMHNYMEKPLKKIYSKEQLAELSMYYENVNKLCDGDFGRISMFMFDTMIIYLEFLPLIGFYMNQE